MTNLTPPIEKEKLKIGDNEVELPYYCKDEVAGMFFKIKSDRFIITTYSQDYSARIEYDSDDRFAAMHMSLFTEITAQEFEAIYNEALSKIQNL